MKSQLIIIGLICLISLNQLAAQAAPKPTVLGGASKVGEGLKEIGSAAVGAVKDGANALKNKASDTVDAAAQLANKAVDATKDALDTCICVDPDFSKVPKDTPADKHSVESNTRIKSKSCPCSEYCNCPKLNLALRRFARLSKNKKNDRSAKRLLASLKDNYDGTFVNGDLCKCDANMVNRLRSEMVDLKIGIVNGVKDAAAAGKKLKAWAKNGIAGAADAAKQLLSSTGKAVASGVANAADAAKQLAGKAADKVEAGVNAAKEGAKAAADKAKELAGKAGDAAKDAAGKVGAAVSGAVGAVGEALAGKCIPQSGAKYAENSKDKSGPWVVKGTQERSKGLCEKAEECDCKADQTVDNLKSQYKESKKECVCKLNLAQKGAIAANQLKNKVDDAGLGLVQGVKSFFGGKGHRFVKKSYVAIKAYCNTLAKDQCLEQVACQMNSSKCTANKVIRKFRFAKVRKSQKKFKMNRNNYRFKQVLLNGN